MIVAHTDALIQNCTIYPERKIWLWCRPGLVVAGANVTIRNVTFDGKPRKRGRHG